MNEEEHIQCVIIGSGPSGYTAAIYAARADLHPVVYQGMQPGGQLMNTTEVDNFPGYPEGRSGPEMMMDLQKQAERFDTEIRDGWVTAVDLGGPPHRITIEGGKEVVADTVIISTGASANWLGLKNELRLRDIGGGVSACAVCDGFFYKGQDVALVGGGDSACEEASYLAKLCNKVYMIVRRGELRASKAMQQRVQSIKNIELLWHTEVDDVLGDESVNALLIRNNKTGENRELPVTGFFLAIGHTPNTRIFKDWLELDGKGYIIHQPDSTKTSIQGVFVAGDAADKEYRQAITAAGTGCMAALDAERYLAAQND